MACVVKFFSLLGTLTLFLALPEGAAAQSGAKCVTPSMICWADPPGPPGTNCFCPDGSSGSRQ